MLPLTWHQSRIRLTADNSMYVTACAGLSAALFAPAWTWEVGNRTDWLQRQQDFWACIQACWELPRALVCQLPFSTCFDQGAGHARYSEVCLRCSPQGFSSMQMSQTGLPLATFVKDGWLACKPCYRRPGPVMYDDTLHHISIATLFTAKWLVCHCPVGCRRRAVNQRAHTLSLQNRVLSWRSILHVLCANTHHAFSHRLLYRTSASLYN